MKGFDRLAPFYDSLELLAFAGALRRSQTGLLPQVPPFRRALLVGGGTGHFLEHLARTSESEIVCLDISGAMLARSEARIRRCLPDALPRIHFLQQDVAEFASEPFDLICTLCVLDCFDDAQLTIVMDRLSALLTPDGCWLYQDFEPRGPLGRAIVWGLYRFFRLATGISARRLPDVAAAFAERGFAAFASRRDVGGLLASRLYQTKTA